MIPGWSCVEVWWDNQSWPIAQSKSLHRETLCWQNSPQRDNSHLHTMWAPMELQLYQRTHKTAQSLVLRGRDPLSCTIPLSIFAVRWGVRCVSQYYGGVARTTLRRQTIALFLYCILPPPFQKFSLTYLQLFCRLSPRTSVKNIWERPDSDQESGKTWKFLYRHNICRKLSLKISVIFKYRYICHSFHQMWSSYNISHSNNQYCKSIICIFGSFLSENLLALILLMIFTWLSFG